MLNIQQHWKKVLSFNLVNHFRKYAGTKKRKPSKQIKIYKKCMNNISMEKYSLKNKLIKN